MRKVLLPLAAALAVAWVVTFAPAAQADNGCVASIQNPHISSNAGGVIAKGNWVCALVPTTIKLNNPYGAGFNLWACASNPPQDENYLINNCVWKAANFTDFTITVANSDNIRYTPPLGQPGAHGGGWWIACAQWRANGPGGLSGLHTTFSNSAYIVDP
jgi:hypothetical protein